MSKTQFVEYKTHGFWAYDVALGIFLKHLVDAAEASDQVDDPWLSDAVSWWRTVACISDYGLTLDEGWSAAQQQTFIAFAEDACKRLASRESIPAEEIVAWPLLDELRIYPRGATEVSTGPVVELGRAVIALISGTLPEPPTGTNWFYGTDDGCKTLGLYGTSEGLTPLAMGRTSTGRRLREDERNVIAAMLGGKSSYAELISSLDEADSVEDMQDGGMGGIRFFKRRHIGAAIAEAEYTDDDGVLVSIVLNADAEGALYELDFWKVDFSPLLRYPLPSDLRLK